MKYLILTTIVITTLALSGCGEDRSHPNPQNSNNTTPIVYKAPTAVIDINSTKHMLLDNGDYRADNNLSYPFILDGNRSFDNDENGSSIVAYDWNITSTFSDGCLDINKSAAADGSKVIIKLCNEVFNNGDINATLTVTDDEDTNATTNKIIHIN